MEFIRFGVRILEKGYLYSQKRYILFEKGKTFKRRFYHAKWDKDDSNMSENDDGNPPN